MDENKDEEISVEDEIAGLDISISALIDVLVEKGLITEKDFEDKVNSYYEEE